MTTRDYIHPVDELDDEAAAEERRQAEALDLVDFDPATIGKPKSLAEARREAALPTPMAAADLVGKRITLIKWRQQMAVQPDTGEVTDGYLVGGQLEDGTLWVSFWGGIALRRELARLNPPVSCVLAKRGRTYVLTD